MGMCEPTAKCLLSMTVHLHCQLGRIWNHLGDTLLHLHYSKSRYFPKACLMIGMQPRCFNLETKEGRLTLKVGDTISWFGVPE